VHEERIGLEEKQDDFICKSRVRDELGLIREYSHALMMAGGQQPLVAVLVRRYANVKQLIVGEVAVIIETFDSLVSTPSGVEQPFGGVPPKDFSQGVILGRPRGPYQLVAELVVDAFVAQQVFLDRQRSAPLCHARNLKLEGYPAVNGVHHCVRVPNEARLPPLRNHVQIASTKQLLHFLVVLEPLRFLVGDRGIDEPQGIDGSFH
jgi:hypothetical protein